MVTFNWDTYTPYMLGFENDIKRLTRLEALAGGGTSYPPYNIISGPDNRTTLEVALAGFSRKDIEVSTEEGVLTVSASPNAEEDKVFAWNGSGEISIVSKKPLLYTLQEISGWVLEDIRSRPLASIKYELSDEKHTEVYNESAFVPSVDYDYGLLVDPTQTPVTTLTTTTVTSDETAPTGVIRVGLNEVVSFGATYTVPQQTTTPTEFIDYNIVNETEDGLWDHGHILDTVAMGYPFGEIYVKGTATTVFQPNWVGSGTVRVDNAAHTNFALGHVGSGDLFAFSGASETLSAAIEGGGLFAIGGTSPYAVGIGIIGEGSLRKFSGAAESLTFNPTEDQILFSFTGVY